MNDAAERGSADDFGHGDSFSGEGEACRYDVCSVAPRLQACKTARRGAGELAGEYRMTSNPSKETDAAITLAIAGLLIAVATALGAFGTHALKPVLPPARFESFEIGVTYHFFHALGLLAVGFAQRVHPEVSGLRWTSRLILIGLTLFSGSIYALTFGAPRWFGMVAPVGGISLMLAWLVFATTVWRLRRRAANL